MRLSIREEIMYQRKAYELSEMIIDTVCAELEEEKNVQMMLDEIENYNLSIHAEKVSEDTLQVPEAVKTITVPENENDKIISDMLDELERELEGRDGQATERKEQSARLKIDDDVMKTSCFGVARAKFNETHKLRSILEDDKIIQKEKCIEAEKIEDDIIDGGYCCLFGGFGGYEEVDFSLKRLNHFTTEDSECHVRPDPLKKFYDLFNYNHGKSVIRDHKNTQHTNNDNKNDGNLNDKVRKSRRSFAARLVSLFGCGRKED